MWVSRLISIATNKHSPKVNAVKVFLVKALGPNICINAWPPGKQTNIRTNKQTDGEAERRTDKQTGRRKDRRRQIVRERVAQRNIQGAHSAAVAVAMAVATALDCRVPAALFYFRFRARTHL